jgi:hypothetical protein
MEIFLYDKPSKLTLLTVWAHRTYTGYDMNPSNLFCLQNGPIKLKLLTAWTHQTYAVYSMDPSNLLFTEWTHQA